MEPLDLTAAPPREPRAMLAGIVFLPRTIDKLRATLPGGDLGQYQIAGFTQTQCDVLGIDVAAFTAAIAQASSDDDAAAFVIAHTTPEKVEAWNAKAATWRVQGGDRAKAIAAYPYLAEREDVPLALDNLVEDDRRLFAGSGERS